MGCYRIPPWRVVLIMLLLTNIVSPFSYVPNPLGLYYRFAGGYGYDEPTLFKNEFASVCYPHPRTAIGSKLDALIGKIGLDPLDPVHPLVSYRIIRVMQMPGRHVGVVAAVEMHYQDAKSRTYDLAAFGHSGCGEKWFNTNIDELTAEHRELTYLPFANAFSSIVLDAPQLLPIHNDAQPHRAFPYTDEINARFNSYRYNATACWSPSGSAFLVLVNNQLWYVARDGSVVWKVADNATQCVWNASGTQFVYVRPPYPNPYETSAVYPARAPFTVVAVDAASRTQRDVDTTERTTVSVVGDTVYYLKYDALPEARRQWPLGWHDPSQAQTFAMRLWRKSLDDYPAQSLGELLVSEQREGIFSGSYGSTNPFAVSPDEQRIAYICDGAVCIADGPTFGNVRHRMPLFNANSVPPAVESAAMHMTWSYDGTEVAVTGYRATPQPGRAFEPVPQLWVANRDGRMVLQRQLGMYGLTAAAQWTPDDQHLIFSVFPNGRRVVGVEVATGEVRDLTQPRWDAFASLAPDGKSVLLWNGRGSFWTADVIVRPRSP